MRYDIAWWRGYWKRTQVQGVIINAGGIVAYYPSKYPLHHRAEFLGTATSTANWPKPRTKTAWPSSPAWTPTAPAEDFFRAHPDWFARDAGGNPYRDTGRYVTCVNSPYYDEYLPDILREIIERSKPGRLHRQQLERPGARQHLLLRQLRAQVPRENRQAHSPQGRTGTIPPIASGSCGTTRAAWKSGT